MIALAGGLPLQWPIEVETMFDSFATLSSAGTTLMIPDCELTTMKTADAFFAKQIAYTFIVPCICALVVVAWSIISCCCARKLKLKKNRLKDYTILSIVLMLFLAYPMLAKLCLSMLKCPMLGIGDGTSSQRSYLMAE